MSSLSSLVMEGLSMPQIFKLGRYLVYFWVNEGLPLEPIHVHVAAFKPQKNATKIWITRSGNCLLCNNNSKIPPRELRYLIAAIEAYSNDIIDLWTKTFGEVSFYC